MLQSKHYDTYIQNEYLAPPPPPQPEAPKVMTCKEDPMFTRFFKMLNFGVPIPAVKAKMELEGLNPDVIDTPDAPSPNAVGGAGGAAAPPPLPSESNNQSDSDSSDEDNASFSDSDDD